MKTHILAALLILASPSVYAGHCPADAKAIDEGLAKMQLNDEVRTAVTDLREKGMAQHEAGDHRASEKTLAEAMRMLLTNSN